MFLPEPLRTTSFRLALAYAGLFVASVLVIMGTTYLAATSKMQGILRSSIGDDMTAFRNAFARAGPDGLRSEVEEHSESAADDRFFLLLGPNGERLSGNIPAELWEAGWSDRKLEDDILDDNSDLKIAASRNSDGEVLLVSYGETLGPYKVLAARNSHVLDETQEIILAALLWGCLATTLLALIGGYIVSLGPTRRVDEIAATTSQIVGGRLDLRLPVSSRRDELDRLASDINGMLSRIEVLMESLKQVSTDIAHDLRTPLARLRQRLETVRRRPRAKEDYETAIDGAMEETDAIIETFNALLRIAQIEAGARRAKFEAVDLSRLAAKVYDFYVDVAADEGHALRSEIVSGIAVDGDEDLLTQVMANLIENAIKHAPAPGRIDLVLRAGSLAPILEVGDDGPGVPEDERDKIFRRLYRLDRSRTTPGSGLGLALVAAIVDLHRARIEALDNHPGLLMRIAFPIRKGGSPDGRHS